MFIRRILAALGVGAFAIACETPVNLPDVATVNVLPSGPTLEIGQQLWIKSTARDDGGTEIVGRATTWSSDAASVATVDGDGRVAAIAVGTATITATTEGISASTLVTVVAPTVWQELSVAFTHNCARTATGQTWCWGANAHGQMGTGSTAANQPSPAQVPGAPVFAELSAGIQHSCGRTAAGAVHCWGRNDFGQIADSSFTMRTAPSASGGARTFSALGRGGNRNHSCATVIAGDAIQCWGLNFHGQLGVGGSTNSSVPLSVPSGVQLVSAALGHRHSCALTSGGAAYCWGSNEFGRLGDGTDTARAAPTAVLGGHVFTSIGAGFQHTCGRTAAGAVYCWGNNTTGELGRGSFAPSNVPVLVSGGLNFASLHVGTNGACGLTGAGVAYCWGLNDQGQLNDGTFENRNAPVAVRGGFTFAQISLGIRHGCGRTTGGEVACWGGNVEGQVGYGGLGPRLWGLPLLINGSLVETWTGQLGTALVTMRIRVIDGAVRGWGTAEDASDPPTSQFTVTGTMGAGGAVNLTIQGQPVQDGIAVTDAGVAPMQFVGTRSTATRMVGTMTSPTNSASLTLNRQ